MLKAICRRRRALANAARARSGQPLRNLHCLLRHGLARGVAVEGDMCGVRRCAGACVVDKGVAAR